jgi:aerobic-type carbon monoxide dehydrogenase small subunit (CoxS/CutS family)
LIRLGKPVEKEMRKVVEVTLKINGTSHILEIPEDMPLLWALRDKLNLVGTKYGCGIGLCGSCTVLVNGAPVQSCGIRAAALQGKEITTIEGLSADGSHPVQRAWNDEDVPQCGYCQAGQILAASALLARIPRPSDVDIDNAMAEVLCRCGTYPRIRKAIKRAADYAAAQGGEA